MADINVERKGPSIWPWIVGLIVLALLIWALVEMFGREDTTTPVMPVQDTVGAYQPGVTDTLGQAGTTFGEPGTPDARPAAPGTPPPN